MLQPFLSPGLERSIIVYSRTLERFRGKEELLAEACASAGFNMAHMSVSPARLQAPGEYTDGVRRALSAFHRRGIQVFALFLNDASAIVSPEKAAAGAKAVLDFNAVPSPSGRFDGLSADLEPNMLKADSPERPKGFPLAWDSEGGWGPDGANLKLLERTLLALKSAREAAPDLKLHAFYSPSWMKHMPAGGEGRSGSPAAFLGVCDRIILMAYCGSPEETAGISKKAFRLAVRDASVTVCVKARKGAADSLGASGLEAFSRNIQSLSVGIFGKSQAAGISIYEFEGLHEILNESKN